MIFAAGGGLFFVLSGFQSDNASHTMATNFLLCFVLLFLELYSIKPEKAKVKLIRKSSWTDGDVFELGMSDANVISRLHEDGSVEPSRIENYFFVLLDQRISQKNKLLIK